MSSMNPTGPVSDVFATSLKSALALVLAFGLASCTDPEPPEPPRPNIVLIMADDMGYGDVGAFGSEIETPNIDALAQSGARFTRFYTHVSCSPTRSLLLTGVDNHRNGMGTMAEDRMPHHEGLPGYVGYLNEEVVTVARLLQDSGYHTYMAGKWHLGVTAEHDPFQRGFERSYAIVNGGGNHFNGNGNNSRNPRSRYTRNGETIERPEGPFSSDLFTDEILDSIREGHGDGRPFFAFLAFTAPHWPLQAPRALIEKYSGDYSEGWDVIRSRRFERMQTLGLVPASVELPPRIAEIPEWSALSAGEQSIEARKMAIYAAMVDNLDQNVGRVVETLKELGEYDNTLIVFLSDNGTDPYDRSGRPIFESYLEEGYDNGLDNMGAADSYIFYGLGWAQVGSVHHRHYKFLPSEGGMRSPTIMHFPGVLEPGSDRDAYGSVLDLTPTFLDVAGVEHPGTSYQGRTIHPMRGRSLLPHLKDESVPTYGAEEPVAFEIFGHGVVYMGPWKAVRIRPPWQDHSWRLYHLEDDPTESLDLAEANAELLSQLVEAYEDYAEANGVIDEPEGVTAYPYKPGHLGDLKTDN